MKGVFVLNDKKIVGLTEIVKLHGKDRVLEVAAICDTGATKTSIDVNVADLAHIGPIIGQTTVKNPSFNKNIRRPVVLAKIEIGGGVFKVRANLQDRSHMTHKVIIGRDILHNNFVVDVSLSHSGNKVESILDEETKGLLSNVRYLDEDITDE